VFHGWLWVLCEVDDTMGLLFRSERLLIGPSSHIRVKRCQGSAPGSQLARAYQPGYPSDVLDSLEAYV